MIKKQFLLFAMFLLPLVASAHDIEVKNADGVTIYYKYINNDKELEVTYYGSSFDYMNEYQGNVVIPEEVTYMNRTRKVTSVEDQAFRDCFYLTSVSIPNSVTNIGENAFSYCSGLTSVAIGNGVTSIRYGTFSYCSGLTSVTIPNSVTNIGESAFHGCSKLTSVTIPNSLTNIGEWAFHGCSGLKKVIVSDIAAWCRINFAGNDISVNPLYYANHLYSDENTEIKDLIIPNSVTSIGKYAFLGCSGLTSVTIPNSVTSIGDWAFSFCSGLTSVTIPNSVMSIGNCAFERVDIPIVVSLIENPFEINGKTSDKRTFTQNTFNNATLYVPAGTIEKYKATEGWKDFLYIEEGNPTGINAVENLKAIIPSIYDLNGVRQTELKKGINIINGKKVVIK